MEIFSETNKNNIIGVMFTSGVIQETCERVCDDRTLVGDLVQEVTLTLLQKEQSLIASLNATGNLIGYTYKIAKNQWQSKSSSFYKKYKRMESITTELKEGITSDEES